MIFVVVMNQPRVNRPSRKASVRQMRRRRGRSARAANRSDQHQRKRAPPRNSDVHKMPPPELYPPNPSTTRINQSSLQKVENFDREMTLAWSLQRP
jgi:hypothetical protein